MWNSPIVEVALVSSFTSVAGLAGWSLSLGIRGCSDMRGPACLGNEIAVLGSGDGWSDSLTTGSLAGLDARDAPFRRQEWGGGHLS